MLKVLITGSNGMLGSCLAMNLSGNYDIYMTSRQLQRSLPQSLKYYSKDLADESYSDLIEWSNPDAIIHCAAITDVNFCQKNPEQAFLINSHSVKKLSNYCPHAKIIFISSDAVFPSSPMSHFDCPLSPQTVYGMSKVKGERFLCESTNPHLIVRTTIVGSKFNHTASGFVDWLLASLQQLEPVSLYEDNLFTPISIWDLALEIDFLLSSPITGIWNISGSEACSKHSFGLYLAQKMELDTSLISKGLLSLQNAAIPRCLDQSMSSIDYMKAFDRALPSIDATVASLVKHLS